MLKTLKQLFQLLTPSQRSRFYRLQILVMLMAFGELLGIASIGPFMALVADVQLLETNATLKQIYQATGLTNPQDFLFFAGLGVLAMLALASVVSIFTTWRLSIFSYSVGTEIADRLYKHYLNQGWLFHASGSSAQLTKKVATESQRVTQQVVNPAMQMNARLVLALSIATGIITYNPVIALIGLIMFVSGYLIIYRVFRRRLVRNGQHISHTNGQRFRLMNEGFGGIKDLILLNRQQSYIEQFNQTGKILASAQGKNQAFSQAPRYFMELIAFGAMIGLVLVLLKLHNGTLSEVLPVLAVYALAGFKLLPALQQIYSSITQIKGNLASFESIKPDLIASQKAAYNQQRPRQPDTSFQIGAIQLNNISFTYPNKKQPALNNVSITIPLNQPVGFVGESGSGKSTAIDIILALIEPQQGSLQIGEHIINASNKHLWQQHIGFVPQSIFLSEGSIAENIAFGIAKQDINLEQVKKAASLARLDELINSLEQGLDTKVGERGVQLSGGQRQRIGIARALYNNAEVLVFDEATSALDGITEKYIMDAIHDLSGQRTIIMIAHRLKTVQKCDQIFMLEKGKLIAQGNYQELVQNNQLFKEMARHA